MRARCKLDNRAEREQMKCMHIVKSKLFVAATSIHKRIQSKYITYSLMTTYISNTVLTIK